MCEWEDDHKCVFHVMEFLPTNGSFVLKHKEKVQQRAILFLPHCGFWRFLFLTKSHNFWRSEMDWEGQKLAEQLMQILLLSVAVAAFVAGYAMGSFQMMLLIYLCGVVITALVVVPNWPLFNRHPLNWLDSSEADRHPKPILENPSSKKKPLKQK